MINPVGDAIVFLISCMKCHTEINFEGTDGSYCRVV